MQRHVSEAKQELKRIEVVQLETAKAQAALRVEQQRIEQEATALTESQTKAEAAEQELVAKRDELSRAVESGGSAENCDKRLKHANQALKEIEEMKVAKDNSLWSRLFGGGS
jgi:transcriptional regulator of heat shock response